MAQIETWLNQDMMQAVKVRYLDGNLFSQDNAGNLIGVKLTRDGEDYSGGGTVSANVIRADGGTVAVTGALSGNVATVVLPQSAYAVPGVVSIVVKLTVSGAIITIAAVVANIYQSSTETAIDPGTIIPSIQTLINQIDTAVASIPADYSSLWTSIAPAFSTSTAYTAGQYVTYNGGLYRFTANHAAGAWSSSDVSAAVLGNDLSELKNAIETKEITDLTVYATKSGAGISATGYRFGLTNYRINAYAVTPGDTLHLEILKEYTYCATYMFQDSLTSGTINDGVPTEAPNSYLVGEVVNESVDGNVTVPAGAEYLIIAFKESTGAVVQKITTQSTLEILENEIEDVDSKVGSLSDLDKPANSIVEAINDVREISNPGLSVQYAPIKASTIGWENKGISANDGSVTSNTARLKTVYPLPSYIGAVKVKSGYRYGVFAYDNGTYVGWWDGSAFTKVNIRWSYGVTDLTAGANNNTYDLYVVVTDVTGADISASNINSMISFYSIARPVIDMQNVTTIQPLIRNGSNGNTSASNPVATAIIFPCINLTSIGIVVRKPMVTSTNHYKITVTTYDTEIGYPTGYSSATEHVLDRFDVSLETGRTSYVFDLVSNPNVKGIAFDVTEVDNSETVVPLRATDFDVGDVALVLNREPVPEQTNNFMICPWFGNRPVYVPLEGYTVKYGQAFLMYDGKIYSTDGSNVAEQNSSFTVLRDVPLSLGHGNGFQLGTNGKGYVSGWNDNNLYVVDLATLTIDSTIQLPTTGYTTAVINEEAGLIYIFQRDSYPNTYEVYNFIVYDYVNNQTVATYKTPVSLRTMQSVDYFGGRIFVVCGSTDVTTHRFLIFDTMCNLICEYKLPDFSGKEPEGVFIDRTDGTVRLMFDNKGIYKIIVG